MAVKVYKPTSAGRRDMTGHSFEEITKSRPERSLTVALRKSGGRNNTGRITVRHRGGGHRRRYRLIDFKRDKFDCTAQIIAIEYDPNRTARIALVQYEDGEKRYIIAPIGVKVGDVIGNGSAKARLRPATRSKLKIFRSVQKFIMSSWNPVTVVKWHVQRGFLPSWWRRKANMPSFVCPLAKSATCMNGVWRPSVK
jgi:hypothetical protein